MSQDQAGSLLGGNSAGPAPGRRGGVPLRWRASPAQLALQARQERPDGRKESPRPFCAEVGRRMLLAQATFDQWVLRRVERVTFQGDRSVLREIAVDLRVPDDAPVFVDEDRKYWLVPIAVMWRRTLVDFHMTDEDDRPLSLPGLRLTQQLDQAILLAAAAAAEVLPGGEETQDADVTTFIENLVAGTREEVSACWEDFTTAERGSTLAGLRDSTTFFPVARGMRSAFTLYAFLDVDKGRDRLIRMSFVEPIRWPYQRSTLTPEDDGSGRQVPRYRTRQHMPWYWRLTRLSAVFGLAPTRLRFQVPTAERGASYHFEMVAPEGGRIGQATLIAGRPNEKTRNFTEDHVEHDTLHVGLHAVEVPPGSQCRAQVELRVQSAGWLAVMALSALAITAVLGSVLFHLETQDGQGQEQYNNVIVLLVATAAAAATFVAHREFGGVAARLVAGVRAAAAVCMALPVVAAGFLAYTQQQPTEPPEERTATALLWLSVSAGGITLYLAVVWFLSWWVEHAERIRSPWDMTEYDAAADDSKRRHQNPSESLEGALERHRFLKLAIGLGSSEAWHEWYDVTEQRQKQVKEALEGMLEPRAGRVPFQCADPTRCPGKDSGTCLAIPADEAGTRRGRWVVRGRATRRSAHPA